MTILRFLLTCISAFTFLHLTSAQDQAVGVDIYIVAGHSTATVAAAPGTIDNPGYTLMNGTGNVTELGSPSVHAFGRAVAAANPGREIVIVPIATQGTSLHKWIARGKANNPTPMYREALRRVETVRMRGGQLRGVLWQPCPNEISRQTPPRTFARGINKLVRQFRHDLDRPALPFVVGQLPWMEGSPRQARRLNRTIRQLDRQIEQFYTVSLQRPRAGGADGKVLDIASARRLGRAYARKVSRLDDVLVAR